MVMVATVVAVIYTHNLAIGVGVGVILSALMFARKVAKTTSVESDLDELTQTRTYRISGQLFFVSTEHFLSSFDFREPVKRVIIDLSEAHLWDSSAVGAIDKAILRMRRNGREVDLIGMNHASATIVDRLALHDKLSATETSSDS